MTLRSFVSAVLLSLSVSSLSFGYELELVHAFTPPELPEGLAIDKQGNAFISLSLTRELRKIAPDGTQSTVATFAASVGPHPFFGLHLGGVAVDARGDVYVSVATFEPDTHGIYRVSPNGGTPVRVAAMPVPSLPNGLAFTHNGDLLITESFSGSIFRLPKHGTLEHWYQHPLLVGVGGFPSIGVNGLAIDKRGDLVLTNSDFGRLLHLDVRHEQPGDLTVLLETEELRGADGNAIDVKGNVYIAINGQNRIVRVTPDLQIEGIASGGDLDFPASLAFGAGQRGRKDLYLVNFAVFSFLFGGVAKPSLMKVNVGVTGLHSH
jgi:sugar lactone lactonase YvrE